MYMYPGVSVLHEKGWYIQCTCIATIEAPLYGNHRSLTYTMYKSDEPSGAPRLEESGSDHHEKEEREKGRGTVYGTVVYKKKEAYRSYIW